MVSSGTRLGAWDYLCWGHIQPVFSDSNIVAAKILVYAGEEEQYFTFISPEAYEALADWINYRQNSDFEERSNNNQTRTLAINFDKGTQEIEIDGTRVLP